VRSIAIIFTNELVRRLDSALEVGAGASVGCLQDQTTQARFSLSLLNKAIVFANFKEPRRRLPVRSLQADEQKLSVRKSSLLLAYLLSVGI
jgi:hypothetical protein